MINLENLRKELGNYKRGGKAKILQRFFKTGPGEYGEGDVFIGLKTAESRNLAMRYKELALSDLAEFLSSKIHEERGIAVMILNHQFQKGDMKKKKEICKFYLKYRSGINNWDLVDMSASMILGAYLDASGDSRDILFKFAKSGNLWERRIAIIATHHFIRKNEFGDALKISEILLNDKEDLIHKAVGWMLREIGNRNLAAEEKFLRRYCRKMPRTMLRYAIEKFPEKKRRAYLAGERI